MRFIPNALSLSRIVFAVILLWALNAHSWKLAAAVMLIGLVTDLLDGAIARRYHVESKIGADILEPVCDLVLSIGAIGGLWLAGIWPVWVPISLAVITVLLQLSHATPWSRLKRHTYYIHPLFFVATIWIASMYVFAKAVPTQQVTFVLVAYIAASVVVFASKRDRWMVWLHGPPVRL